MEFVRRMIESRDNYSPNEKDFWQRERYEKTTFALNNFDEEKQKKWLYRKFDFLTEYIDTSAVTVNLFLPYQPESCLLRTIIGNLPAPRNNG